MTREIKFRAFHQTWGMRYFTKPEDFKWFFGGTDGPETTLTKCELMQYTGLKDKNGKEIYEGDILKIISNFELRKSIDIQPVSFRYYSFCVDEWDFHGLCHNKNRGEQDFEIIGNIYENPDLLKQPLLYIMPIVGSGYSVPSRHCFPCQNQNPKFGHLLKLADFAKSGIVHKMGAGG